MLRVACALVLLALAAPATVGAAWEPRPAQYGEGVTRDLEITMRDGVILRADVYYPTLEDGSPAPGPFPVLVSETPYGKEAAGVFDILSGHRPYLVRRGYIQALVDVRGQGVSEGSFQLFGPDEMADSREVIAWAAKLPRSTGEVGMTGESYLGKTQLFAAAAVGRRSPLKAIFPIVAANDPYRDFVIHGGLLNLASSTPLVGIYGTLPILSPVFSAALNPAVMAKYPDLFADRLPDLAKGFAGQTIGNVLGGGERAYDGPFWADARRPQSVLRRIVRNRVPAFLVGAHYDVFQRGAPLNYSGLQNAWAGRRPGAPMGRRQRVTGRYQLLIKPEYHTTVDHGEPNLDVLQLRWFDRWLRGEQTGILRTRRPLHVVEPGGTERRFARFPPSEARVRTWYLREGGALRVAPPPAAADADTLAFTGASLPCDRSTEQFALGVLTLALQPLGLGNPCAAQDIVPASIGPGQLTYTSGPMARDRVVAGPIAATIYATANTTDTQWVVKLSDVAPDGTSVDLTQGVLLGSHRALTPSRTWRAPNGLPILPYHPHTKAAKTPVTPDELTRYDIEVRSTFVTLRKGHRLRLTLLSSQTPHLLPLPEDLVNLAGGVYAVQRSAAAPSSLQVPLVR